MVFMCSARVCMCVCGTSSPLMTSARKFNVWMQICSDSVICYLFLLLLLHFYFYTILVLAFYACARIIVVNIISHYYYYYYFCCMLYYYCNVISPLNLIIITIDFKQSAQPRRLFYHSNNYNTMLSIPELLTGNLEL